MTLTRRLRTIGRRHLLIATSLVVVTGGALAGGAMASAAALAKAPATASTTTTTTTLPAVPWPGASTPVYLYVDTESAATQGIYGDCEQGNEFVRGEQVLFRVAGTLESAAAALTPTNTSIMAVDIPGMRTIPLVFGTHSYGIKPGSKYAPEYWTAVWKVPASYPLGTVNFYIHAVALKSATSKVSFVWRQIPLVASSLTIEASS